MRDPNTLAKFLQILPETLGNWRSQGKGPAFIKVGGKVMYSDEDVSAWLASRRRTRTATKPQVHTAA
jgi:predicted site-specific integrase-resolvase